MLAPAVGRLVAELVTGSEPDHLLAALAPDRSGRERLVREPQMI
jgi:glycine/D-amino acid oxidase-like deaminating enzyme